MTISLTEKKKVKIKNLANHVLSQKGVSIRNVASLIGNMTAAFEAVPFGRMYYRHIEICKTRALEHNKYDFEAKCELNWQAKEEIKWWIYNIDSSVAKMKSIPEIDKIIYTDASNEGWGAHIFHNQDINGRWSFEEQDWHIKVLKMMAIKFALLSYMPFCNRKKHIRVMSDNTTAISYINKQGGTHNIYLNDLAVELWEICKQRDIHLSAAHIPGKHNILADSASREFVDAAEWMLSPHIFNKIVEDFGMPDIDLFASRLNRQLQNYVSWKPDPESIYIDAMSISWHKRFVYIFPPFSMMWPVLTKLEKDQVEEAIIIAPYWPTQSWFPRLMKKKTLLSYISSTDLILPGTSKAHPLSPKLKLLAVKVQRDSLRTLRN